MSKIIIPEIFTIYDDGSLPSNYLDFIQDKLQCDLDIVSTSNYAEFIHLMENQALIHNNKLLIDFTDDAYSRGNFQPHLIYYRNVIFALKNVLYYYRHTSKDIIFIFNKFIHPILKTHIDNFKTTELILASDWSAILHLNH